MPEFRLETALRRRRCHYCLGNIEVGEEHLATSNAYSNRRGNLCSLCVQHFASKLINNKIDKMREMKKCKTNRPKISDTPIAGKACQKKYKTVAS